MFHRGKAFPDQSNIFGLGPQSDAPLGAPLGLAIIAYVRPGWPGKVDKVAKKKVFSVKGGETIAATAGFSFRGTSSWKRNG